MSQTVLYVDASHPSQGLQPRTVELCAHGFDFIVAEDVESAKSLINSAPSIDVLIIYSAITELLQVFKERHPDGDCIVLTDTPFEEFSKTLVAEKLNFVNHIIALCPSEAYAINELRVTLQKFRQKDFFGIEKYLQPCSNINDLVVQESEARESINQRVMDFALNCGASSYQSRFIYGVTEELLMNALLDAPRAFAAHHQSNAPQPICKITSAKLRYGCDGEIFAISVTDPFGALERDRLFSYVNKVSLRKDSDKLIDKKAEGAGLGIYKILFSSRAFICQVSPGRATEMIVLIDLKNKVHDFTKMPRTVHYFQA